MPGTPPEAINAHDSEPAVAPPRREPHGFKTRAWSKPSSLAGLGAGVALAGSAGCNMARERAEMVTGSTKAAFEPLPDDLKAAAHALLVLNRIAFGPKPGDIAKAVRMGIPGFIEEQLSDSMAEDRVADWRVNSLDVQEMEQDAPDMLAVTEDSQLLRETQQAALLRAVYSSHQLRETMADFWTNHFNIYALKSDGRVLIPTDTEHVIRPHVLSTFRDMILASAHSPAMLTYLDNRVNRKGVANENYARELLELHTVGVKGGYAQRDIQEIARCFTGWTIQSGVFADHGTYRYDPALHDDGAKFIPFLNLTIAPNRGQKDAEMVLDRLALHPATAHNLATKLCRRYLGHAPDNVVQKAADAYLKSGSDIRATLRPILLDALTDPGVVLPIIKRPLDFTVSALRALGADTDGAAGLQKHLAEMGQPLYQWPMPDGFPEKTAAWTATLMPRWNFALALASNAIEGTQIDLNAPLVAAKARSDDEILDALLITVLSRPASAAETGELKSAARAHLRQARRQAVPDAIALAETTALLIGSPQFQMK